MGRGKHGQPAAATSAAAFEAGKSAEAALTCAACGGSLDATAEEYLNVHCNTCSGCSIHFECAVEYLLVRASEKCNSNAATKYKLKARKNPAGIFAQHMPCCAGIHTLDHDGDKIVGSSTWKGKKGLTGACSGFTTGAEVIKPAKEHHPPPPPVAAVPRGPNHKTKDSTAATTKDAASKGAAAPKRAASAASSASSASAISYSSSKPRLLAPGVAPRGAGAAARLLGPAAAASAENGWTPVGTHSKKHHGAGGGQHSQSQQRFVPGMAPPAREQRLKMPAGVAKPAELQMCNYWLESGECFMYNCPYCHNEAELPAREKAWLARLEAQKKEAARRKAAAEEAAAARLEEEQEVMAQLASMETLNEVYTASSAPSTAAVPSRAAVPSAPVGLTARSLSLLRAFKRSNCLNSLLEMGFGADQAGPAADAAAGEVERALQILVEGGVPRAGPMGCPLVDVTREAAELASLALATGLDSAGLEGQLALAGGNWQAVVEALQEGRPLSSVPAMPEDYTSWAPSEPDTPSVLALSPAAPWATDASSSLSNPSPDSQSPTRASAAAGGALAFAPVPAAAPGVLSLADFSEGPFTGGAAAPGAAAGWQEGIFAFGAAAGGASESLAEGSSLAGGSSFHDGYAAGLEAAAALYTQEYAAASKGVAAGQGGDEEELGELLGLLGIA